MLSIIILSKQVRALPYFIAYFHSPTKSDVCVAAYVKAFINKTKNLTAFAVIDQLV